MALMKWEPFQTFEKMFEDFPLLPVLPTFKTGWDLAVDLYTDKGNLVAEMNLPGVEPKELDITFQKGTLRVAGKKIEEKEVKEKEFYRKEIHRGVFEKIIQLPFEVQGEKTEAHYKDGVLKILMPMKEEVKKQTIKVQIN
jgi:HSP20 family protein